MKRKVIFVIIILLLLAFVIFIISPKILSFIEYKNRENALKRPVYPATESKYSIEKGIGPENIEECDKIVDEVDKSDCYSVYAVLNKDSSVCEKITINTLKDSCLSLVSVESEDLSACDSLPDSDKVICYTGVAIKKEDINICDSILEFEIQKDFYKNLRDTCYSEIAFLKKDTAICGGIFHSGLKEMCVSKITA